ncbi:MAG: fused MFS/spermidine synthase [Planctomycetota bacterium]
MNPLLYSLFFVSGALGLVYEVVWMRELSLVFGASAPAVATVLAVFLLGLALGAFLIGRWMAKHDVNPWRAYATLEIVIAACAFALPSALRSLEPLFASAYGSGALAALRFGAALVLLLPPTICLGGTLPVMARALEPLREQFGRQLAWLYAANTGGAALGAFLAPFVFLPKLGAPITLYGTPVLNLAVGIAALVFGRSVGPGARAADPPTPATHERRALGGGLLVTLALLSGFVVILLEVAATRLLAVYLGQSTYGFGLMLTCFVLGLALGAWAVGGMLRLGRADGRLLAPVLALAAVMLAVMLLVLGRIPWWLAHGALRLHAYQNPFPLFIAFQFLLAMAALLPPAFALGMVFPVLLAAAARAGRAASQAIGLLYGVNTAGSVLAALIGGFVLVPLLGTHAVMVATGVLTVAAALLVIGHEVRAERSYAPVGALLGLVALGAASSLMFLGKPEPQLVLRSPWLYGRSPRDLEAYEQDLAAGARQVEFLANDAHGVVGVGRYTAASPSYRFFSVNGKVDGGAGDDMFTQVALGSWPCLLFDGGRRDPASALLIGLGTGTTAGTLLSFPLRSLDVVEISPTMPYVARTYFADVNRRALDDPRTHLVIGDGRHHLAYGKQRYDVIVSEPSNPWIAGIGFLFSQQSFALMRDALTDGGVACQWLQFYDMSADAVASVLKTFASVFPCSFAMMAQDYPGDLLLLGLKRDLPADHKFLDYTLVQQAFARHQVADEHRPYAPVDANDLLHYFLIGPQGTSAFTEHAIVNTDGNAFLEFETPKMLATEGDSLAMSQVFAIFCEPASRYVSFPTESAAPLANTSLNDTLMWRLLLRAGFDATPLLPASAGIQTRVEGPALLAANASQSELNDFVNLFGECSLVFRLAGIFSEFQLLEGHQPPVLLRYGQGFVPDKARDFFEKALKLEPDNLDIRLDLAMNCQYGKNGKRYTEGWDPNRAAALYQEVLQQRPGLLDAKLKLINVIAKSGDLSQAEKLAFETYHAHQDNTEAAPPMARCSSSATSWARRAWCSRPRERDPAHPLAAPARRRLRAHGQQGARRGAAGTSAQAEPGRSRHAGGDAAAQDHAVSVSCPRSRTTAHRRPA